MAAADEGSTYYRKGFGLKAEVQETLDAEYSGRLVDRLREQDYTLVDGDITIRLAKEFGFCYGVERAVEYAYQTRSKFPGRHVVLVGEIIHNPHVNGRLRAMGVEILEPVGAPGEPPVYDYSRLTPADVVILPAFGVTVRDFEALRAIGCVVVDTTCGSVLNVWKRVESYARDGFTALIHGKHYHEETQATASQVTKHAGGRYLIVRDMGEARDVMAFIEGAMDAATLLAKYAHAASPGFDPERDLKRIGVANQTTMLATESLAIAAAVTESVLRARGEAGRADVRSFDTICSATQDRQDAVTALLDESLDLMLVVGGYNSSNTISLAMLCAERAPTYHIEDAAAIDVELGAVRHRPAGKHHSETITPGWLSAPGPLCIGITAGASTPNNKIGETVARVLDTRRATIGATPTAVNARSPQRHDASLPTGR